VIAPAPHRPHTLEVAGFHALFAIERRLHRVDRWRLPVPYGIPLRSLLYAALSFAVLVLASHVLVLGAALAIIPGQLRLLVAPIIIAGLLTANRPDGRCAHRHLIACIGHRLTPRRMSAFRAVPAVGSAHHIADEIVFAGDGSGPRYPRAQIVGPARVLLRYPARAHQHGNVLQIAQAGGSPLRRSKELVVRCGQRVVMR
jgi:hypothetical protein